MAWIAAVAGAILSALVTSEATGWTWHLAVWISKKGASRMPPGIRENYEKIFVGELDAMRDRPLSALVVAFRMFRDSRMTASLVTGAPLRSFTVPRRVVDIVVASALLVAMAPLLVAVATAIRFTMGSPVVYRQERIGKGQARFALVKFRTMMDSGFGEPMVPPVGRVLRRLSLDELPQLWNVVKGDMAMVGPRPELAEIADSGSDHDARFDPRPGLAETWPFPPLGIDFFESLLSDQRRNLWLFIGGMLIAALISVYFAF